MISAEWCSIRAKRHESFVRTLCVVLECPSKRLDWLALAQWILDVCLESLRSKLQAVAAHEALFSSIFETAFGKSADARDFRAAWLAGDWSCMPSIEIRRASEINGAKGAFAAATGTIYLAHEFVEANIDYPDLITAVLLEEYGHYIDSRINSHDSAGDEGDIFARLVQGKTISASELESLRAEDDTALALLDGQNVQIEQNAPIAESAEDLLSQYTFKGNVNKATTNEAGKEYVKGSRKNDALYAWQQLS